MEPLNRPGESSKLIYEIGDHIKGTEFLKKLRHLIYQNLKFKGKNFHFFDYCCDRFQIQVRNKSRCDFQFKFPSAASIVRLILGGALPEHSSFVLMKRIFVRRVG